MKKLCRKLKKVRKTAIDNKYSTPPSVYKNKKKMDAGFEPWELKKSNLIIFLLYQKNFVYKNG